MIQIRPSQDRGRADHGWLDARHTFSFADYHDPEHMGFSALRVLNEDRVQPGQGFPSHPHRDMEILTFVLSGTLEHADSMGNGSQIRPGDVQRMSAGTGVLHSEVNPSRTEPVHLLQVWILPERRGLEPSYEQRAFAPRELAGRLRLVASRDGRDGSVLVHQDAAVLRGRLRGGERVVHAFAPGRAAWAQIAAGSLALNGKVLKAGDGAAIEGEGELVLAAVEDSDVLLFDLPPLESG